MTRNFLLQLLLKHGIVQQDSTLNPVFHKRLMNNPTLTQALLDMTSFLRGDVCLKTRVHALLQGITTQPTCIICGRDVAMRMSGRYRFTYPTHCSNACISKDPSVLNQRAATNLERYGAKMFLASSEYHSKDISVPASKILV